MSRPEAADPIAPLLQSGNGCLSDALGRPMKDLRISVTDRCNFRCSYCMPLDRYEWIEKGELLTFAEILRLARIFIGLGVEQVRLTGGEPLLRRHLERLIEGLADLSCIIDLSVTTNGSLLRQKISALAAAGLKRLNVSIDTLDPDRFRLITRRDDLAAALDGLFLARERGLYPIKVNAVIIRGINDRDIPALLDFAREHSFVMRFIEYMDAGNANGWETRQLVPKEEILERIDARFPLRMIGRRNGRAPSVDYEFADGGGTVGVVASVTEPFCSGCSRVRLTADGKLVTCLFSDSGHDLKALLRSGADDASIAGFIRRVWSRRSDRYSEERLETIRSGGDCRAAHGNKLEMIHLGG